MKKIKEICMSAVSFAIIFTGVYSFAVEDYTLTTSFTEDYIKWQSLSKEEKEEIVIPRVSSIDMPEEFWQETDSYSGLREQVVSGNFEKNAKIALAGANGYELSRFNLNDKIRVNVKHQGNTNECWAFSMTSVLETNLALTKNVVKSFSPRHMDYSFVRTFTDGINSDNLNREVGMGGLPHFGIAYLSNGRGAVLESQMPFVDNEEMISIAELNKPVDTIATETVTFPSLYKRYGETGEVVYTNGATGNNLKIYDDNEVRQFRNAIKNHIVNYSAISAVTAGNELKYYSNQENPAQSVAYFCNDSSIVRDHAVTIVGWDDNYSRNNFTGAAKPKNNGAYICLNSYGASSFENGYLYISYEDSLIETYLYGIKSANTVDYDKIYQYNLTGENTSVGMNGYSKGYIAEVFDRDASKEENLKFIGVNIPKDVSLKIYVNSAGSNAQLSACTLVATTEKLSAGYHRIPIKATNLTGDKFAVVIEELSYDERFEISIEIAVRDSIYSTILGNPGKSLYSLDGYNWLALSSQNIVGFDMRTADMTIKAFTLEGYVEENIPIIPNEQEEEEPSTENRISSTVYTIKDTDIYNVSYNTTVQNFKKNISISSENIEFYDSNRKLAETDIVKTGTTIRLTNNTYTIIVKGDTSCDGKISLVDLSKIVAHYGDENKYGLSGNKLKAADLNIDGKISLTDISIIVDLIGKL